MELEREVDFCLEAQTPEDARALLAHPERALARLGVFRDLELSGRELRGTLVAALALLGEVRFPFRARFEHAGEAATLHPLDAGDEALRAELSGRAWLEGSRVCYRARVRLAAHLPEGEKWGGRAFKKMAEAAFVRTLERTLAGLGRSAGPGLLD